MLGDKLKLLRLSSGLTQKQVYVSLNMSDSRYNQYETNRRSPDYETLKDIAKFYKVSLDYLLDNETEVDNDIMLNVKEKEVLKNILIKEGYMTKDEFLSDNEYSRLMQFIVQNKNFIKENK